jgi:hypothetical protein
MTISIHIQYPKVVTQRGEMSQDSGVEDAWLWETNALNVDLATVVVDLVGGSLAAAVDSHIIVLLPCNKEGHELLFVQQDCTTSWIWSELRCESLNFSSLLT